MRGFFLRYYFPLIVAFFDRWVTKRFGEGMFWCDKVGENSPEQNEASGVHFVIDNNNLSTSDTE